MSWFRGCAIARFGLPGPTYQSQSLNSDAQKCVNFYPETDESGYGKTPVSMYGTPGFTLFSALGGISVRGEISIASSPTSLARMFAISGAVFYEIFIDGTFTIRNPVNPFPGTGLASMAASPTQILIIDGGQAFCYNLATNAFQPLQTYTLGLGAIAAPIAVAQAGINYSLGDVVEPAVSGGSGATFTVSGIGGAGGGTIIAGGSTIGATGSGYIIGDTVIPLQGAAFGGSFDITAVNEVALGGIALAASPIANGGGDYAVNNIVDVVQAGGSGGQAQVTAVGPASGGQIFFATPSTGHGGSGYHMNDLITITSGAGSGALLQVASLVFGSEVGTLSVLDAGTGYTNGATHLTTSVSSPGGTGLEVDISASGFTSGAVTSVALFAAGSGYTTANGVATSTGGSGLGLTLNIVANTIPIGGVTAFTLSTAGSGYTTAPNVPTSGGTGVGFLVDLAANPITGGGVTAVTLTTPGTGYSPVTGNPGAPMTNVSGSLLGTGLQLDYSTSSVSPGSGMIANPIQCGFCGGFFVVLQTNSQVIQASQPEDASTWDPTQIAQVSDFADNIVGMLVDHLQIWLWGSKQTVPYYLSGNIFPFDPYQPGFIEQGMASRNSAVRLDNSVFWIGADERGGGIAWRANGYTPQRVSNHAVIEAHGRVARSHSLFDESRLVRVKGEDIAPEIVRNRLL